MKHLELCNLRIDQLGYQYRFRACEKERKDDSRQIIRVGATISIRENYHQFGNGPCEGEDRLDNNREHDNDLTGNSRRSPIRTKRGDTKRYS